MADTSALPVVGAPGVPDAPVIEVEFCGERSVITTGGPYRIGRDADLVLDTAPTMPAELLQLDAADGTWFVRQLASGAEVSLLVAARGIEARLAPGRSVPILFATSTLRIATSRTPYEVEVRLGTPVFEPVGGPPPVPSRPTAVDVGSADGDGPPRRVDAQLNPEQRVLVVVLAATVLRHGPMALSEIPSSVEAAGMLGWPVTKFNRKLDTVCGKLDRAGIGGLHGGDKKPALNRRTRLVQEVVRHGIVDAADLALLEPYPAAWAAFGTPAAGGEDTIVLP